MSNSNISGYDITKDPLAPSLLHDLTPEAVVGITATASVDATTGTPNVVVQKTKVENNYNFDFAFSGLKGSKGDKGDKGDTGATGARGIQGAQGIQGLQGIQGPQGTQGVAGIGITNVSYLADDHDGNAIYRITLSNGATYDFTAYKGPQGERGAQGLPGTGEDGVGINDISYTSTDSQGNYVYLVTLSNGQTYTITAPRGPQGLPGNDGATPSVSATASVDNTTGSPAVVVTQSGTISNPVFNFAFTGLKGEKGDTGGSGGTLVYEDNVVLSYSAGSSSSSSVCSPTEQITNKTALIMKTINIASADLSDLSSGDSIRVVLTLLSGDNALGYRNAYLGRSGGSSTGSNVTCVSQYEVDLYGMGDKHRIQEARLPIIDNSGVPIPAINYCYAYAPVYAEQCARYQGSGLAIDFVVSFDLNNIVYDSSMTFYNDDNFVATDLTYKVEVYKL